VVVRFPFDVGRSMFIFYRVWTTTWAWPEKTEKNTSAGLLQ